MSACFDHNGDLWVEVAASKFAPTSAIINTRSMEVGPELNLTAYIRSLTKPDWVNAALTSTSANITVEPKDAA